MSTNPEPGWYTDPATGHPRWWDGTQWTASAPTSGSSPGNSVLIAAVAALSGAVIILAAAWVLSSRTDTPSAATPPSAQVTQPPALNAADLDVPTTPDEMCAVVDIAVVERLSGASGVHQSGSGDYELVTGYPLPGRTDAVEHSCSFDDAAGDQALSAAVIDEDYDPAEYNTNATVSGLPAYITANTYGPNINVLLPDGRTVELYLTTPPDNTYEENSAASIDMATSVIEAMTVT